jgi:hypothetical protein
MWLRARLTGMTVRPRSHLATTHVCMRRWALPLSSWFYRGRHRRFLCNNPLGTLLRCQKTKREDLYKDSRSYSRWRKIDSSRRNAGTNKTSIGTQVWRTKGYLRSHGFSSAEIQPIQREVPNSTSWPCRTFDFEACLRVSAFQFTRGSALYRE